MVMPLLKEPPDSRKPHAAINILPLRGQRRPSHIGGQSRHLRTGPAEQRKRCRSFSSRFTIHDLQKLTDRIR